MKDKLTAQQELAVFNRGGRLLVSAAAGSGKTKVLVERLLTYITDENTPANLEDFLIITYTNAAAAELRGKIAARLSEKIAEEPENQHLQKQMQRLFLTKISTIHGFCGDLLREYAYRLDLPADFRVADENECQELREDVLRELLDRSYREKILDADFINLVDSQSLGRDDRLLPEIIQQVYDSARCHKDPQGWLNSCLESAQTEASDDAADTQWGKILVQQLHDYLDVQISLMNRCAEALGRESGLEKAQASILDTVYQMQRLREVNTWDDIRAHMNISFMKLTFPRTKNPNPALTDQVKAIREPLTKKLPKRTKFFTDSGDKVLEDLQRCSGSIRALVQLVREFDRDYSAAKRSRHVLDFSDLEQRALDLLLGKARLSPTSVATEIGRRFREVLVDEYQDSNGVQDAIFMALTQEKQNCFLVGDVKQSIYQFRLADPGIFLQKYHAYVDAARATDPNGRKILLSDNFRSGPEVIQAVNDVFRCCMSPRVGGLYYTEAEQLREGRPHDSLGEPGVELYAIDADGDGYQAEAEFVAYKIEQMLLDRRQVRSKDGFRDVKPEDIVILLRSAKNTENIFRKALENRGIRCATSGGEDLLKTEEIQTLRALLEVIQNPRQDIPLLTALASPIFGFTADELALLRGREKRACIYDVLRKRDSSKFSHFLSILEQLRADAKLNSVTALLEQCLTLTRLDSIYASMPDGTVKSANLRAFFQIAANFEQGSLKDLSQFLNHLSSLEGRGIPAPAATSQGCVSIMTIHKSKGLEFPVVFLCNLSRRFNRTDLNKQILCDRELGIGVSVADPEYRIRYPSIAKQSIAQKLDQEAVSEELRILYVAMTRAEDRLIMTVTPRGLEKKLKDLAMRQCLNGTEFLCSDVSCPGDWVLIAALRRSEAGALQKLGGRPEALETSAYPWKIEVVTPEKACDGRHAEQPPTLEAPKHLEERLKRAMEFQYPYEAATLAPSKQTATDRKGRVKDEEAAQDALDRRKPHYQWRKPNFQSKQQAGKTYGSAIHAALQYISYDRCTSLESITEEVHRLVDQRLLSQEQGRLVNCQKLANFFQSEFGRKLVCGIPCLREFKFSILDDGMHYGSGLEGEQVLLQGVVDCALLEEDGITVLDFKTDFATEETLPGIIARYRVQVETYAAALERIYEQKVKQKLLYFFHLEQFIAL